jgi:hypothetical protein
VDPGVVAEGVVSLGGFVLHAVKRQGNTSAATNKSKSSFFIKRAPLNKKLHIKYIIPKIRNKSNSKRYLFTK